MAKSYTYDRVIFPKGLQTKFIFDCRSKLNISYVELAKICVISRRTLSYWISEKKKMSYNSVVILSKMSGVTLPIDIKIKRWNEHLKEISRKGGVAHFVKYGIVSDELIRKKAWRIWWNKEGKYKDIKILKRMEIKIPSKDIFLAEFIGIIIGDGCMTNNSVRITLDSLTDKEYILYVQALAEKLFGIKPRIYKHKKFRATDIVLQRVNLIDFLKSLGLKTGNKIKQNIDIPSWIKKDKKLSLRCVRGLMDTDGCIFIHSYKVNGKTYNYNKIAFTSKCSLLLESVRKILINLGLHVRMTKDSNDIRIENKNDVAMYMAHIGTSNQKFINKMIKGDVSELV